MRFSVKLKLATGFGVVILLSLLAAVLAVQALGDMNERAGIFVNRSMPRVKDSLLFTQRILDLVRFEKNMIIDNTKEGVEHWDDQIMKGRQAAREIRDSFHAIASDEGKKKIEAISATLDKYLALQDQTLALIKTDSEGGPARCRRARPEAPSSR